MASAKEVKDGYASTLQDLTFNSKPLINVLTMLADENSSHARDIVEVIETYLQKVRLEVKLPVLYLIDCIMKNVGEPYTLIFCENLVSTFCMVFEMVDERTRAEMFKLRQTWNEIIPSKKLYALDVQINHLDPAWPVTAPAPSSIYFNPKFLKPNQAGPEKKEVAPAAPIVKPDLIPNQAAMDPATLDMHKKLLQKQQELIELQQKKIELELLQTQVKLQEQLKTQVLPDGSTVNIHLKPEVAKTLNMVSLPTANNKLPIKNKSVNAAATMKAKGSSGGTGPRINPVSSNLALARPIKDPRLMRHQTVAPNTNNINSNINIENKGLSPQPIDNKDVVTNKVVRESRLAIKDASQIDPGKAKSLPRIPKTNKNTDTYKSNNNKSSSASVTRKGDAKSSSPTKKLPEPKSRSPLKSSKIKKPIPKIDRKLDKSPPKSLSSDRDSKKESTTFKSLKGSKNRNYVKRNRDPSLSPEPIDVDLRIDMASGVEPLNKSATNDMDVDLRKLPDGTSKKRLSTDQLDVSSAKKSKNELMDALFGSKDTDLRIIPNVSPTKSIEKPSTPPPPIISDIQEINKENTKSSPKNKSNLDMIRAKLANATNKDKLNDETNLDVDLRNKSGDNCLNNSKIFISPAEEHNIKTGNMTTAQQTALVNKIMAQLETHKLMEAKRKDRTEIEKLANTSLTPISDEEIDGVSEVEVDSEYRLEPDRNAHPPPGPNNMNSEYGKFPPRRNMDIRPTVWRGRRGRGGMPVGRPWGPRGPDPWIRPPGLGPNMPWRPMGPHPFMKQQQQQVEAMDVDEGSQGGFNDSQPNLIVSSANLDNIKSINIDGIPRDIRYYDETAVAFMNWDDPREISFHNGSRRVLFDEDSYLLNFNEAYREITINGNVHKVRLGGPTREIYIDSVPYECYFGGPGIGVELNGRVVTVKMEGPPPQVRIGEPRTDLVGGKINLIVDAKNVIPIFLDGKVQRFEVEGKSHTLQFTDALRTALINDQPFKVEFGGLPKAFIVDDNKHFIRFSVLPKGIRPGFVNIKDMKGSRVPSPVDDNSQETLPPTVDTTEPALPVVHKKKVLPGPVSPDHNSNSAFSLQNFQPNLSHLDVLSSVISSSISSNPATVSGYSVAAANQADNNSQDALPSASIPPVAPAAPALNINDLFQKLVATGIVTTLTQQEKPLQPTPKPSQPSPVAAVKNTANKSYKPVFFDKPETLKTRQPGLIAVLHSGMQCSSCGMRFPPEHSKQYSQHLDWHFRQNRKGKKNIRKAASRRWFYGLADWKNYEEVEDLEEKEKNYFDQQQAQGENENNGEEEEGEIPSVIADRTVIDPRCEVCQDKFEQFYNEEKEEWHLKNATRVDGKTYHPLCYDDYLASLESEDVEEDDKIPGLDTTNMSVQETTEVPEEIVIEDDEDAGSSLKEDDEEVEVKKDEDEEMKEEPVVDEEADSNVEADKNMDEEEEDDDVIINEVVPERIILDDDDCMDDEVEDVPTPNGVIPKPAIIKEEPIDDGFMEVGDGLLKLHPVKIKTEPVDEVIDEGDDLVSESRVFECLNGYLADDNALDVSDRVEETPIVSSTDTTHSDVVPLIDGNLDFESGILPPPTGAISGKIKINITKPIPVLASRDSNKELASNNIEPNSPEIVDPSQPLPPGEESIQLNLKPSLQGLRLRKQAPVKKGVELTGMCSIM